MRVKKILLSVSEWKLCAFYSSRCLTIHKKNCGFQVYSERRTDTKMRKEKTIVRPTKATNNEPKTRNIYNGDIGKKTELVRVKNFISQKQLPDTLHLTANVSNFVKPKKKKTKSFNKIFENYWQSSNSVRHVLELFASDRWCRILDLGKIIREQIPKFFPKQWNLSRNIICNRRKRKEIPKLRADWINKYSNLCSVDEVDIRLDQISQELSATGTYTLTSKELEFGARTAWRNASRVSEYILLAL